MNPKVVADQGAAGKPAAKAVAVTRRGRVL